MAIITLTTDFGQSDYYVGAIKGIILQIAPKTTLIDITHDIPPQNIFSGSLILREIARSYPPETIHVAVVDPGVGTERKIILAKAANQLFLMPDNGLITLLSRTVPIESVWEVTNSALFCHPVSPTFHGRDIFAPVAASLASKTKPHDVGPAINSVNFLDIPQPKIDHNGQINGIVVHVDHFGNLITSIQADQLRAMSKTPLQLSVTLAGKHIGPVNKTFTDVPPGSPIAYIGSAGFLEIAVNQSRADKTLNASNGTTVTVT